MTAIGVPSNSSLDHGVCKHKTNTKLGRDLTHNLSGPQPGQGNTAQHNPSALEKVLK